MKNVQLQSTEEVPVVCLADGTIIQPFGYICEFMGIYNEESEKAGQKYINIPEVKSLCDALIKRRFDIGY